MNLYTRIGMYFFLIGALLSVLDGAFIASEQMRGLVYVLLIFLGLFAGILNVTEDEEHHFLVSGAAFLLVILAFNMLFVGQEVLAVLTRFLQNAVAFIGSMVLVVAIKTVLEFGSQNYHVTPQESMDERTGVLGDWQLSRKLKVWNFIVFLAVCLTFIIILLSLPLYVVPESFLVTMSVLEWVVIAVFIIDLVVLYRQEQGFESFLRNCWVDIIAAIPIPGVFGAFKIIRIARIARVTQSLKFFSTKSGVNTYLRKRERRTEDLVVREHPRTTQTKRDRKAKKR